MTLVFLTPCQTFTMNHFAKTFNNFTSFAINAKYELTICLSLGNKEYKNHTHVKKVGHTSEFLFGIY